MRREKIKPIDFLNMCILKVGRELCCDSASFHMDALYRCSGVSEWSGVDASCAIKEAERFAAKRFSVSLLHVEDMEE